MFKIGICGHYGDGKVLLNGQTIKTKSITDELSERIGKDFINTLDTYEWKKNPIKLLLMCYLLIRSSKNIIIITAQNGIKVLLPIFICLNVLFKRKLHLIVIGGWLSNLIEKHKYIKYFLIKLDGVYVETKILKKELEEKKIGNLFILPNFKKLNILSERDLRFNAERPFKICTFSRVMKEKGIEDAIESVSRINTKYNEIIYILDIYGQIDDKYIDDFNKIKSNFPEYVNYMGSINYNDSVSIIEKYFVLLFPTQYKTEGIPGTIIDAYAAGVPVIVSNWDSSTEVVENNKTGIIYEFMNNEDLIEKLTIISKEPELILRMKKNCLESALKYTPDVIIDGFIKMIE